MLHTLDLPNAYSIGKKVSFLDCTDIPTGGKIQYIFDSMIYTVIIIGAGASGLFAAAQLPSHIDTLIVEGTKAAGKKLLLTGGGRCNITATESIDRFSYAYNTPRFVKPALYTFSNTALMEWFESCGLPLTVVDKKVFPASFRAQDVRAVLLSVIKKHGHKVIYNNPVIRVDFLQDYITVYTEKDVYKTRHVIFSCGGKSFPHTGSNGKLIEKTFPIIPFTPALCRLFVSPAFPDIFAGITLSHVRIQSGKTVRTGSMLFSPSFITGPAVLDISGYVHAGDTITVNLLPNLHADDVIAELKDAVKRKHALLKTVFHEIIPLPKKIIYTFLEEQGARDLRAAHVSHKTIRQLVYALTDIQLRVTKKGGFNTAIVSRGGVNTASVDAHTMALKDEPRVMVIGEALDVDGKSGGYNLQFAWSSAFLAAAHVRALCREGG